MTWPTTTAPATAPTTHAEVRTQAYHAGGGDYFRSGYYSHGLFTTAPTVGQSLALNRLVLRVFVVPVRRAFDRIGINVSTAATAASGGVLRMGIYSTSSGLPSARIVDAGTVSSESTGAKELTIAQTLDPGIYWLAVVAQVATCSVTNYGTTLATPYYSSDSVPISGAAASTLQQLSVSGALPNPVVPVGFSSGSPAVCLRAA